MRTRLLGAVALTIAFALAAAQPAPAQVLTFDCEVADGGRIVAANGDDATFGGSASTVRSLAHQVYVDHGPVSPFRFRSLTLTATVCDPDGRRAELYGTGRVDFALGMDQIVEYRIAVADVGEGRRFDAYRITLSNGYDSGEQLVRQGNVQIRFP
jgi:hypothetical protein